MYVTYRKKIWNMLLRDKKIQVCQMEQTLIFLNKKAHPYKDIKIPKEKLCM